VKEGVIMSDLLNHYFCGIDTLKALPVDISKSIDKNLFLLGAQGADIFFYYNILPFRNNVSYGSVIHNKKINQFFYNFLEYIKNEKDEVKKNKLYSYFYGFTCHHALDVNTHPFIINHSGKYKKEDNSTEIYRNMHKKYEVLLDVSLLKYKYNIQANKQEVSHIFKLPKEDYIMLDNLYEYLLDKTYELVVSDSRVAEKSIKSQGSILKILIKPNNCESAILKIINKLTSNNGYISTAVYPDIADIKFILNLNNDLWCHPCYKENKYNSSYVDLFEKSISDTCDRIIALNDIQEEKFTIEDINEIYKGLSYETGLPWKDKSEQKYFNMDYIRRLREL
jgi:Zinc dependent phospholipase C